MPLTGHRLPAALLLAALAASARPAAGSCASLAAPPAAAAPSAGRLPFGPRLSGCWLSVPYLAAVRRTYSARLAENQVPDGLVALYLSRAAPAARRTRVDMVYNFHESTPATLHLAPRATTLQLELAATFDDTRHEITFRATATDTVLVVRKIANATGRVLRRYTFRQVARAPADARHDTQVLLEGIATALRRQLVAGSYAGTDSVGSPIQARFLPGGQVTGLPFRTYQVAADYITPSAGDELLFDNGTEQRRELAATFGPDTLRIYTAYSDSTDRYWRGRLRYQLVRVRRP